jgi:hypothetical protein
MTTNFFSPLSFVAVFGSGIRDPRSGIRDKHPGSATLSDPNLKQSVNVLINEFIILEGFRLFRTIVEAVVTELLQPNLHGLKPKPL